MPRYSPNPTAQDKSDMARLRQTASVAARRLNRERELLTLAEAKVKTHQDGIARLTEELARARRVLDHARDYGVRHARRTVLGTPAAADTSSDWEDEA